MNEAQIGELRGPGGRNYSAVISTMDLALHILVRCRPRSDESAVVERVTISYVLQYARNKAC